MILRNPLFYLIFASFAGVLLILYLLKLFTFRYLILFGMFLFFWCGLVIYLFETSLSAFFSGGIKLGRDSRDENLHEMFSADIEKARYSKSQNRFQEALKTVNAVLAKSPDCPEALYLKAQILWDGFGNDEQALKYLDKILQSVDEQEGIHRWASTYYSEVHHSRLLENDRHNSDN